MDAGSKEQVMRHTLGMIAHDLMDVVGVSADTYEIAECEATFVVRVSTGKPFRKLTADGVRFLHAQFHLNPESLGQENRIGSFTIGESPNGDLDSVKRHCEVAVNMIDALLGLDSGYSPVDRIRLIDGGCVRKTTGIVRTDICRDQEGPQPAA